MKRFLSVAAVVAMVFCALALAACGGSNTDLSDSKYVGTWKIDKMTFQDESEGIDDNWTLVLNGDGTGQSITDEETDDLTWELTKDGFKTKGGVKASFVDDGDNIKTSIFGVDLIFIKQ